MSANENCEYCDACGDCIVCKPDHYCEVCGDCRWHCPGHDDEVTDAEKEREK